MKSNIAIFWILAIFCVLAAAAYTIWNLIEYGEVEWVGSLAIGLSGILSVFIGIYLQSVTKEMEGVLPEDMDADIDDADPEIGHFSPWSWWPIVLAAGASLLVMGLAISIFIAPIGIAVTLIALVGWTYEYYRGNFGR
ncbi:aa3-type cytochrome oxidase subunit IV [Humidisolicoccus flavus]|uniref:aa3-type cytochrome oxidase subunit IV n=1 Tax=Humidisolicoccus flavus TaxID=3111414 RepID=UPI003256050E